MKFTTDQIVKVIEQQGNVVIGASRAMAALDKIVAAAGKAGTQFTIRNVQLIPLEPTSHGPGHGIFDLIGLAKAAPHLITFDFSADT